MGVFVTFCYTLLIVLSNRWLKAQSNLEPSAFDFSLLTLEELESRRYGSKVVIGVEQSQILVVWSCKACLLIMYHRLTRTAQRNENIAIRILSAYVALGFVVIEVLYFAAWCRPFRQYYAVPTDNLQCNAMIHHRITKAVFNLSSDIIMLCIALQMLIRSSLPMKRKLILCGIFSLGIFVITASILNSYYCFRNPYQATWIYWYVRESSTAILVANLPFTWTILRRFFEVGDFDETNPPPWTYHTYTPRKASGSRTAHSHRTSITAAHVATHHYSRATSHGTRGTRSIPLVVYMPTAKRNNEPLIKTAIPDNSRKSLKERAILHHDFSSVPRSSASAISIDLDQGVAEQVHLPLASSDYDCEQGAMLEAPRTKMQNGVGASPNAHQSVSLPLRVQLAAARK